MPRRTAALCLFAALAAAPARALDYEIQVYPSETAAPGTTFAELHSNMPGRGHEFHETLEVTRGFTPWFETGAYLFTNARDGAGWDWAGAHLRPRVRAPESWGWPVGVSLSAEAGYWRQEFSEARWDLELRPIVDWRRGRFYASVNPALDKTLRAYADGSRSFEFAPAVKLSWDTLRWAAFGLEYYGVVGPVENASPLAAQSHTLYAVFDLLGDGPWEVNAGAGVGLTRATEASALKLILGRRF